jgi:inorganic pyrophosphatase
MPENDSLHLLLQAHPWHGVDSGPKAPERVNAYIEIVPTDTVKYELDKPSGLLRVDRPQRFSSLCPALYGFVPQTYCGESVAARCAERAGRTGIVGDGDPLDICVFSERSIPKGGFLLEAIPVGGLRMIDGSEADDKILAVLAGDAVYGEVAELDAIPRALVDRLRHYFLTYKQIPGEGSSWSKQGGWQAPRNDPSVKQVEIAELYGRAEAHEVIRRSQRDYCTKFGDPAERRAALARHFAR